MEEYPMSIDETLHDTALYMHTAHKRWCNNMHGPELCVCESILSFFQINIPLFSATIFISKCIFVRVRAYDIYLVD